MTTLVASNGVRLKASKNCSFCGARTTVLSRAKINFVSIPESFALSKIELHPYTGLNISTICGVYSLLGRSIIELVMMPRIILLLSSSDCISIFLFFSHEFQPRFLFIMFKFMKFF